MIVDVPPAVRRSLADPARPLFITEGSRKADAAVSRGLCCVALLGVWSWRGSNQWGGKAALPDWESVALNKRQVFIAFDSDVMIKPGVYTALARLKPFLEQRGAKVGLIYLPAGEGGTKTGLDDFLAAGHSVDDLLALARPDLISPPGQDDRDGELPYKLTPGGLIRVQETSDGQVKTTKLTNFRAQIVGDIREDDGTEERRVFGLEAVLGNRMRRVTLPAAQFNQMRWPVEHLGAGAVVYPNAADHARTAIQLLSTEIAEERVFTHTGWRELDGEWVYLHGGGAIGAAGAVPEVNVALSGGLANYALPEPPDGADLVMAIRASLSMGEVGPPAITFPLLTAIYRAALGPCDFAVHLAGPTGAGKSEKAALAQQHYGAGFDARHLPGSWSSTGNALEELAFAAKDALLVVDDFAPTGGKTDVQRLHRDADRVLRAQGNNSGRLRMRADGSLRTVRPPRGLILSTGEDVPRGKSIRARLLVLELAPDAIDFGRLTACQRDAAAGLYAESMAGFVRWLAPRYSTIRDRLGREIADLREAAYAAGQHRRTPDIVAELAIGLRYLLAFAQEAGAFTPAEAAVWWERGWAALGEAAAHRAQHQASSEPTQYFLSLLRAALTGGRVHVATPDGEAPEDDVPEGWGWRGRTRQDRDGEVSTT